MENPNEYVGLQLANNYIHDRHQFEESRQLLKQIKKTKPSRFYCAICRSLVTLGHMLVVMGTRLERYDLLLRQSKI
jgi:hypothetical protein